MTKKILFLSFAILCLIAVSITHKSNTQSVQLNPTALENIEALTDNERSGTSSCKGWFGKCSFTCKYCGYSYWAIGSTFVNKHKCKQ